MKHKRFILLLIIFSSLSLFSFASEKKDFVIVLDAGHGGSDGGANGVGGLREKDVTLDVALQLGAMIEKKHKDVKVIYTRKTDVFVPLYERASIANKADADLFISIHCNSAHSGAKGTETFVLGLHREQDNLEVAKRENSVILLEDNYEARYEGFNPKDPASYIALMLVASEYQKQSIRMAQLIENEFVGSGRQSRGVKQAGFLVIRETAMPSVLCEIGFITNQDEGSFLSQDSGRKKTVNALFNAFKTYKDEHDEKSDSKDIKGDNKDDPESTKEEKPVPGKVFKVQFLVSKYNHPPNSPAMKGLRNVEKVKDGNNYKYFYGATSYESERDRNLAQVKSLGFKDAFIVTFDEKGSELAARGSYFTVLLFQSRRKFDDGHRKLKGLRNVQKKKENGVWKYYYGKTTRYNQAISVLRKAKAAGFKGAVILRK